MGDYHTPPIANVARAAVSTAKWLMFIWAEQHNPSELSDQSKENKATRERIVEAARELFFKQGYTATGVAQILKVADANSGSLYHFFPSKDDLLVAVLEKYQAMLGPQVLKPAFS